MRFVFLKSLFRSRVSLHFQRAARQRAGLWSAVKILDDQALLSLVPLHPDNKNLTKKQGRDRDFPPYLYHHEGGNRIYFIICDNDNRIIAGATLRPHKIRASEMLITQISVHRQCRNQGYATRLLMAIRDELNAHYPHMKRLTISRFMPMGRKFLRHKFIELSHDLKADTFEVDF